MEPRGHRNHTAAAITSYRVRSVALIPSEWAGKEAQREMETLEAQATTPGQRLEAWLGRWHYK